MQKVSWFVLVLSCIHFFSWVHAEDDVLLYSYWRSSCSWRVRIALNLKGIEYQYIPYHSIDSLEEYKKLNPLKKVPTLCINGRVIPQSVAIMEYLEETHPYPALLPSDAYERTLVRQLVQMIVSDIQPLQNGAVLRDIDNSEEWARYWIEKGLRGVEQVLKQTSGNYSVGDQITLADLCLIPQVWNARRYGVDLTEMPNIVRVDRTLAEHPAFRSACPECQPDSPY